MLTSIGRAAARRITTTTRLSASSQLLSHNVAAVTCPAVAARAFTVSAWTRLPASKTPPKKKTKAAATKKATAKKTATTKAKPKAVKPKAVKPKPKPKPKAKVGPKSKVITPEEQEKLDIRELKRWALLNKITGLPETPWLVYITQEMKPGEKDLVGKMSQISAAFKNLYSYEREPLETKANSNRATNEVNHKAWVESHPPARIYLANQARRRLSRKMDKKIRLIHDERLPKSNGSAYNAFVKSRFASGGHTAGSPLGDSIKAFGQEWTALSDAEKRPFEAQAAKEAAKYAAQIEEIRAEAKELQKEAKAAAAAKAAEARAKTNAKAAEARAKAKANANAETK
ncbi:hypothetical protein BGZ61DRAFT_470333 [Ilyonectria robusta]|uniref:uncharacterized protein n=1 Tax=Ilyonectria robusta TaxID=1079257 RepID=UPI001E8E22B1|nr:uncharacterized protein BGZ61DRAFT_470333 [Ilyonectria robusta]KAH8736816.1 hypothetical protein BGZ61DRAFT_470333 [Ilyonectria robusta]